MEQDKSSTIRFLSFSNDQEDAEKEAKLKEAAARIEQAIAREKSLGELVDYNEPLEGDISIDPKNDTRSLYERLMEQKNKKKEALEESQKLSNLVSKLDEDEASYLNEVAKNKREDELKKKLEIYDALEEKRRLEEKNMDLDEQKMKQFLIGGGLGNRGTSSLKSKLSSKIKIKPKTKASQEKNIPEVTDAITAGQGPSRQQCKEEIKISSQSKSDQKTNQNIHNMDDERLKKNPESDDNDHKKERRKSDSNQPQRCLCEPKNIMKSIGILPSLPIVKRKYPGSSDEDSDDSSDQLDGRLLPRTYIRRRK